MCLTKLLCTFCSVWYTTVFLCAGSAEKVNDGQFHTVELLTFNRMLNLSVDGGEPTTLDSQRRSTVAAAVATAEAPLYVGGKTTCPVPSSFWRPPVAQRCGCDPSQGCLSR